MSAPSPKKAPGWLGFALDFGPLFVFFLAYRFAGGGDQPITAAIASTGAFMVAMVVALIVSKWKLGRISPMLWLSTILVVGFGSLTLYFRDIRFIQHKPTFIYAMFAAILLIGWLRGKAAIRYLFEHVFEGVSEAGWLALSRNWGFFFLAMVFANEAMVQLLSQSQWVTAKVWGVTAASLMFGALQVPMLVRHGLSLEDKAEAAEPPTQG